MASPVLSQLFWHEATRWGELQIVLPAGLIAAMMLALRNAAWRMAAAWLGWLLVAMLVTLASKLAFIGWGYGYAPLNFTGASGHAVLAAAVFPLALVAVLPARSQQGRWGAAGVGVALAVLVGVSRIAVGAHSWSEVLAGWILGALVTLLVGVRYGIPPLQPPRRPALAWLLPVVCMATVSAALVWSPSFNSHRVVTQLSLTMAGRAGPYTRADMLRDFHQRHAAHRRSGSG